MREMYTQLTPAAPLLRCPVCKGKASLWQFAETPNSIVQRVVMCTTQEKIGPQDGLINEGCLLYMPPDTFYRGTARDAIKYWNEFAAALNALRILNERS